MGIFHTAAELLPAVSTPVTATISGGTTWADRGAATRSKTQAPILRHPRKTNLRLAHTSPSLWKPTRERALTLNSKVLTQLRTRRKALRACL